MALSVQIRRPAPPTRGTPSRATGSPPLSSREELSREPPAAWVSASPETSDSTEQSCSPMPICASPGPTASVPALRDGAAGKADSSPGRQAAPSSAPRFGRDFKMTTLSDFALSGGPKSRIVPPRRGSGPDPTSGSHPDHASEGTNAPPRGQRVERLARGRRRSRASQNRRTAGHEPGRVRHPAPGATSARSLERRVASSAAHPRPHPPSRA